MIGNLIGTGRSFRGAVAYNLRGHHNNNHNKCAWWDMRNVPGDDPELGATMMEATSRLSTRVDAPVLHFSIDWHPDEKPTQERSRKAADAVLERLGLGDHQSLIFCHQDAAHPHIHLVVNRVHPETGKAWAHWKSKEKIEKAVRATAEELGFWSVAGRHDQDKGERKERKAYRRDQRLAERTDEAAQWTALDRIEQVFAARDALPIHDYSRAAKTFRNQRKKVLQAEKQLARIKSLHKDLLAERRSALWNGLTALIQGKSPRKSDREAKRLDARIAGLEKRLALAHSRNAADHELLETKRKQLDMVRERIGDRATREQKRQNLARAVREVAAGDLLKMKMPRRERQRLIALIKSEKGKNMPMSSSQLMLSRKLKERDLERVNAVALEREEAMHKAIADLQDMKKELDHINDLIDRKEGGAKQRAADLEKVISSKHNEIAGLKGRHEEARQLCRSVNDELADLEMAWYDAREREKRERGRER